MLQLHKQTVRRLSTLVQPSLFQAGVHHAFRPLTQLCQQQSPSSVCLFPRYLSSSSRWRNTVNSSPPGDDSESSRPSPTTIKVLNLTGHQDREIRRSYPNGKPKNLVQGLERLTAQAIVEDEQTDKRRKRHGFWHLRSKGDAICRYLAVWQPQYVNALKHEIKVISKDLGHHPHYMTQIQQSGGGGEACIFVIMCTTHVPYGLSLKDVKLAERIDEAILKMTARIDERSITVAGKEMGPVQKELTSALSIQARIYRRDAAARVMMSKREDPTQPIDNAALDRQFELTPKERKFLQGVQRKQSAFIKVVYPKPQDSTQDTTQFQQPPSSPLSPSPTRSVNDTVNNPPPTDTLLKINHPPSQSLSRAKPFRIRTVLTTRPAKEEVTEYKSTSEEDRVKDPDTVPLKFYYFGTKDKGPNER